ncbi:MAG: hypothetical protein ABI923_09370 [bacterium]
MRQPPLLPEDVCEGGVFAIRNTLVQVKWALREDISNALKTTFDPEREKVALNVDRDAEHQFRINLKEQWKKGLLRDIEVWGEESIGKAWDCTGREGVFALADMIDGTDLLERNLSNWCSAAVFFRPRNENGTKIIAACVGLPSGKIYYAHANSSKVYYQSENEQTCDVGGKSTIKKLSQASICFYGQKASRLKKVADLPLLDYLSRLTVDKDPKLKKNRLYTLAGIPMMVKLIDHQVADAANIDVVFEAVGQHPHDVVAGAFIAQKAGAFVINLDTQNELTNEEMEAGLLRPGDDMSQLRYIITSTRELCEEILPLCLPATPALARFTH